MRALELTPTALGQEGIDLPGGFFPIQAIEAGVEAMLLGEEISGLLDHGLALLGGYAARF